MVDAVRDFMVELAERIVGQRSQMNHGIETDEVLALQVPHVSKQSGYMFDFSASLVGAEPIKIAVAALYVVASVEQHPRHDGADVSAVSRKKYFHCERPN